MNKRISSTLIALISVVLASMADITELPVKIVDGKSYYYYDVQPKETIYSICRRLNISKEQLFEANPSVASDGLKANSTLYFPKKLNGSDEVAGSTHLVRKGETIYGICHTYGITPDQLEKWNPDIREGLKAGMMVYVTAPGLSIENEVAAQPKDEIPTSERVIADVRNAQSDADDISVANEYLLYKVKDKETFYSIAHSHGISVADLEAANPETGILKAGQILRIPSLRTADNGNLTAQQTSPAIAITVPGSLNTGTDGSEEITEEIVSAQEPVAAKGIDIAVILPFMAEKNPQPRQSQLYTEFYKGLLLAVDSMRHCGTPIKVLAFDTNGSDDSLRSILSNPELKNVRLIIAPENDNQLEQIADFGDSNDVSVLNLFAIRSQAHLNHPSVFQANIPHNEMYTRAVNGIVKDMSGRIPVIISTGDSDSDKQEFIRMLKRRLAAEGIEYKTVNYTTALSIDDLSSLDRSKAYSFIPASVKQTDLNRILPALIEFKQSMMTVSDPVRLYGYPEWTTFRGETLENMHAMNTYVYSRFFTVPDDPWASEVQSSFQNWYGVPMGNFVPRQGLLGFDTGMYIIGALRNDYPVSTYNGVQNGFHFNRPEGVKGHVNTELYFVNFRPSGLIDRIEL